jgi:hypothetical protein
MADRPAVFDPPFRVCNNWNPTLSTDTAITLSQLLCSDAGVNRPGVFIHRGDGSQ